MQTFSADEIFKLANRCFNKQQNLSALDLFEELQNEGKPDFDYASFTGKHRALGLSQDEYKALAKIAKKCSRGAIDNMYQANVGAGPIV